MLAIGPDGDGAEDLYQGEENGGSGDPYERELMLKVRLRSWRRSKRQSARRRAKLTQRLPLIRLPPRLLHIIRTHRSSQQSRSGNNDSIGADEGVKDDGHRPLQAKA